MKISNDYLKKYKLESSSKKDIDTLIKYKLNSILKYASNLSNKELDEINKYVKDNVPKQLNNYKLINLDGKIVGCILIEDKYDGVIIDELYIEEKYRNNGIGTELINNVISNNNIVYLWVYKLNVKAIRLYKRLGFKIIKETENRYYMQFNKKRNKGD